MSDPQRPRVLLVDDDEMVLSVLADQLRKHCDCHTESDARQALTVLESEVFDVIISDMVMPNMSGDQFLAEAYHRWPHTERILITGYADTDSLVRAVNGGKIFYYLKKPWNTSELLEAVQAAHRRSLEWP